MVSVEEERPLRGISGFAPVKSRVSLELWVRGAEGELWSGLSHILWIKATEIIGALHMQMKNISNQECLVFILNGWMRGGVIIEFEGYYRFKLHSLNSLR